MKNDPFPYLFYRTKLYAEANGHDFVTSGNTLLNGLYQICINRTIVFLLKKKSMPYCNDLCIDII
jgi:hypothetical protein